MYFIKLFIVLDNVAGFMKQLKSSNEQLLKVTQQQKQQLRQQIDAQLQECESSSDSSSEDEEVEKSTEAKMKDESEDIDMIEEAMDEQSEQMQPEGLKLNKKGEIQLVNSLVICRIF